jgi:hypothetical protein
MSSSLRSSRGAESGTVDAAALLTRRGVVPLNAAGFEFFVTAGAATGFSFFGVVFLFLGTDPSSSDTTMC